MIFEYNHLKYVHCEIANKEQIKKKLFFNNLSQICYYILKRLFQSYNRSDYGKDEGNIKTNFIKQSVIEKKMQKVEQ